ncbi:MAG: D-glycero-beta-D-manno-heptose-7-phosphate kinase [Planctomycetota bacterium]|nr:MAG: D-glycero-beta-D-manno-heptose-7-phosphate kinase [Planctomycetota bacterium]
MRIEELKRVVETISSPNILLIGDLMLDRYVWGEITRISPEAPIQVLDVRKEEVRLGGAGNVAHNLRTLGARVQCVGVLGQDFSGRKLQELLEKLGIGIDGVFTTGCRPTTIKTRFLSQNQQVLRVDNESREPIEKDLQQKIGEFLYTHLSEYDLVVISDYGKGLLTEEVLSKVLNEARARQIPTLIDPKGRNYQRYRGASVITPNRKEAEEATGIEYVDFTSIERMASSLLRDLDLEAAVITLGGEGIFVCERGGKGIRFPAQARSVYDVTGAGDTVIAALAVALGSRVPLLEAVQFANAAAALVVERLGAVAVSCREILDHYLLHPGELMQGRRKIKGLEELLEVLEIAKDAGKKVVFTNGCFDILHQGHIAYLRYAKSLGDILVVGVNSDSSVRLLKGEARPFAPLETRMAVLAALEMVDYLVVFEEATPLHLIERIRPHVLIKGEDYQDKIVVGREIVEADGGRVVLAPLVEGISSTLLAERIARRFPKKELADL